jgi:hypothetical protein
MANTFEVVDCRGRKVICSEENWCDKILGSRPWMKGWETVIKEALRKPLFICTDKDKPEHRQAYYMLHTFKNNRYIKVLVVFNSKNVGRVISAFPTASGKDGESVIWTPLNR